jgi:hypothetical protein
MKGTIGAALAALALRSAVPGHAMSVANPPTALRPHRAVIAP